MILEILILLALILGTIADIRTREVPDTLSFGFIGIGFLIAIILSFFYSTFSYLLSAALGYMAGYILGLIFYYTGMWGGGDAKIVMGIGVFLGLNIFTIGQELPSFFIFIVNSFLVGAIYGIIWMIVLGIKNSNMFKKEFAHLMREKHMFRNRIILFIFLLIINAISLFTPVLANIKIAILVSSIFVVLMFYLSFVIKAIEKSCMFRKLSVDKLTEGDWVIGKVKLRNSKFLTPDRTGISSEDIVLLKTNKVKEVMVKEGIPFLPSFLIAYILLLVLGNWFLIFV